MRKLEGTLSHGHSIELCKFQTRKDHNLEIYKTRSMIKLDLMRDQEINKQRTTLETYPKKKLYAIRRNLGFAGKNRFDKDKKSISKEAKEY